MAWWSTCKAASNEWIKINMHSEQIKNTILLLRNDARRLYERIKYRAPEYLMIFSMKRTRAHFPDIFENRYSEVKIEDLKYLGEEVIIALDQYYTEVEKVYWYLKSTEDMPNKVETHVYQELKKIDEFYNILMLYLDAELGIKKESLSEMDEVAKITIEPMSEISELDEVVDKSSDF